MGAPKIVSADQDLDGWAKGTLPSNLEVTELFVAGEQGVKVVAGWTGNEKTQHLVKDGDWEQGWKVNLQRVAMIRGEDIRTIVWEVAGVCSWKVEKAVSSYMQARR